MAVTWGLLSTANINLKVLAGAAASDEVEIVAVGGRDAGRTSAYAQTHGIARAHAGYDALLADPDVEAIYISLPNGLHVDWTIRALEAGKHVLCEKPMDRTVAEVQRAFDVAASVDRLLMEGFMWRHNPQTLRLAELVREGAIGDLRLVRSTFSFPLDDPENVRLAPALDGGALMDVGCYCVSGSRLFAGEPLTVSAQQVLARSDRPSVDVRVAATMRHAGDVLSTFDCGFDLAGRDELELIGSGGSLFVDDPWHCLEPRIERRGLDGAVETIDLPLISSYRLELENLSAAIRGTAAPLLGREDAVGQAATIAALYASAATDGGGAAVAL